MTGRDRAIVERQRRRHVADVAQQKRDEDRRKKKIEERLRKADLVARARRLAR